jgi:hypothetical protein
VDTPRGLKMAGKSGRQEADIVIVTILRINDASLIVDVVRMQISEAAIIGRICRNGPPLLRDSEV